MSSFLNKFAEKAQSAINASPLGAHIPHHGAQQQQQQQQSQQPYQHQGPPQQSPTGQQQQSGQETSASGGGGGGLFKQRGFGTLQNSLRALQVQYSKGDDRQIQLVITAQKSVALDFDGAGTDAKTYSKELYLWGQDQDEAVKDVSDRLAYLNFVHGTITTELSTVLDGPARAHFKTARNMEVNLRPRRQQRSAIDAQIARLGPSSSNDAKIAELEAQKAALIKEDEPQEKEIENFRREALVEGEKAKWTAVREYAEKLILLSQASETLLAELPTHVPSTAKYEGHQRTAAVRHTLQQSLDNYKPGSSISATSPFAPAAAKTSGGPGSIDTRSFGETHSAELSRTPSVLDKHETDKATLSQYQKEQQQRSSPGSQGHGADPFSDRFVAPVPVTASRPSPSVGVNPSSLNNAPAPIPTSTSHATSPTAVPIPTSAVHSPTSAGGVPPSSFTSAAAGAALGAASTAPLNVAAKHSVESQAHGQSPLSTGASPTHISTPSDATAIPGNGGPTVAETGVPLQAGYAGPGPVSGSLSRDNGSLLPKTTSPTNASEHDRPTQGLSEHNSQGWSGPGIGGVGGFKEPGSAPSPTPGAGQGVAPGGGVGGFHGGSAAPAHESAEDEKKRLEREERERVLRGNPSGASGPGATATGGTPAPSAGGSAFPSAEEEKRRFERAERDRILAAAGNTSGSGGGLSAQPSVRRPGEDDDSFPQKGVPPPYDEFSG